MTVDVRARQMRLFVSWRKKHAMVHIPATVRGVEPVLAELCERRDELRRAGRAIHPASEEIRKLPEEDDLGKIRFDGRAFEFLYQAHDGSRRRSTKGLWVRFEDTNERSVEDARLMLQRARRAWNEEDRSAKRRFDVA